MTGILWLGRRAGVWFMERAVRPVGRVLGPTVILGVVRPFAALVAALELAYSGPTLAEFDRLPAAVRRPAGRLAWKMGLWRQRSRLHRAKLVSYWSDRLSTRRWARLCRFEGSPASLDALGAGARPVILATLHYGPVEMLHYWLRSRRVPVAILVAVGEAERPAHRIRLLHDLDRRSGLGGLPHLIPATSLRDAAEFLQANRVLIVVLSGGSGTEVDVGSERVSLRLSPGALRLASLVDALVIPCIISAGRGGAVSITLADAVDPDAVRDRRRHRAICDQMFRFFLPSLQASPGQCEPWLLGRLRSHAQTAEASLERALEP
jgi:lauroyl/myristoyl acyltransferase